MSMTMEPGNASAGAPAQRIATTSQRDTPKFAGFRGEDVQDWLDSYVRVSAFNHWDDTQKLRIASFSLLKVAETRFLNNAASITDWVDFTAQLRLIFGYSAARSNAAKKKLEGCRQHPQGTYTSYIEDVLALCRWVNKDMSEADHVRHLLKGIAQFAFNALTVQNPATVSDVTATCQRLDDLQSESSAGDARS